VPARPLRGAGLAGCGRRPGHGYRLARPAAEITLLDVVEALGGPVCVELPAVPVEGGTELHRRMLAGYDAAAEAGQAVPQGVSLADLFDKRCC
jgi:Rrf2 family transcriptional regulator, iron-sulfur cluster assembly transcription factor